MRTKTKNVTNRIPIVIFTLYNFVHLPKWPNVKLTGKKCGYLISLHESSPRLFTGVLETRVSLKYFRHLSYKV